METKNQRRSFRPKFSLMALLLLATLAAVLVANWRIAESNAELLSQLPALRNYARELVVEDPNDFAVVAPHKVWMEDYRWHLYVPDLPIGTPMVMLQLEDVTMQGVGDPVAKAPLPPGEHELELRYDKQDGLWSIRVFLDGDTIIEESMPEVWNDGRGSRGANAVSRLVNDPELPIKLFQRNFNIFKEDRTTRDMDELKEGILLWVDVE